MTKKKDGNAIIGERLRCIRIEKHLTQEEFGEPLGYSKNSISSIETGAANISKRGILAFCYWYGISLEWLLYGNGSKYASSPGMQHKEIIDIFDSLEPDLQDFYLHTINGLKKLNRKR